MAKKAVEKNIQDLNLSDDFLFAKVMANRETTKIFLNTKGKLNDVDEETKEFLHYLEHTTDKFVKNAKSDLIRDIHEEVKRVKENKELEMEYMTLYMRDMENREEAREEERILIITSMYENGISLEQISKIIKMPIEDIERLLDKKEEENLEE